LQDLRPNTAEVAHLDKGATHWHPLLAIAGSCYLFTTDASFREKTRNTSTRCRLRQHAVNIPRIPRSLLFIAILAGPVIGLAVHRLAAEVERDLHLAHIDRRLAAAAAAIESELRADLEVLYGLQSLFEIGPPVTREHFASTARPSLDRHPSIHALEWAPRITKAERLTHERSVREEGLVGYSITERRATGEVAPAGERDLYYPVAFVEPLAGNEPALGFDLGSDRLRRRALERAAASDAPVLTDPVNLVQATDATQSVLALLAVPETNDGGTASPSGFLLAVLDIEQLLGEAQLGRAEATLAGIDHHLLDEDVDGQTVAMVESPVALPPTPAAVTKIERSIDVGGQRWLLVSHSAAGAMDAPLTRQPMLLGSVAALAWELLVGLVVVLYKRGRDQLERRHARFVADILESLSDGVIVADTEGTVLTLNRAAIAMTGRGGSSVKPSDWSEKFGLFAPGTDRLYPADELPLVRAIRGEATDRVEILVRNPNVPDGAHVSVSGAPMLDAAGLVRGGVVVFRDVSDRKKAEEHLQRLSSAVEQTADSVLITDRRGIIEYVNPAFEETTGYSAAEVLGQTPRILKSGAQSPDYYRELWSTILRGDPFRGTTVNRKKNGDLYHAEQTITGIRDREGKITHFVSVLKDMTERRRLQEQEIEMELAARVQRRLFPAVPPKLPGYDLAGAVFSAEATSGDYFDFVPMADRDLAIVVADVTGHGVGPALVMAQTRAYLHSLAQTTDDLGSIGTAINGFLAADLQRGMFVTMLLARLNPATGHLSYINAGHPKGYIIDQPGEVSATLDSTCLPLGIFGDRWQARENEAVLDTGETVVMVTDGVLERESPAGEEFGTERLLAVLREHHHESAQEILDRIHKAIQDFAQVEKQADDVTIVICKRLAEPE
jgi:PAS domain S-box-containing protein